MGAYYFANTMFDLQRFVLSRFDRGVLVSIYQYLCIDNVAVICVLVFLSYGLY